MTDKPIYVGIENEFQLMREKSYENFSGHFQSLLQNFEYAYYARSSTAIRTSVGSSLYADGAEPEVCTSPVRVQKGFAQKATDALYLARRELVDFISSDPSLNLIGFSMHWNLTNPLENVNQGELMKALVVPYSLLSLTPVSSGINLRSGRTGNRLELLADHISDEDQIRAFLLFYAGTVLNIEANIEQLPLLYIESSVNPGGNKYDNPVLDGRYTPIEVLVDGKDVKTISAQDYLQVYFEFFKNGFEELATPEDMENLEAFITGRKKLEVDKFKKYAFVYLHKEDNLRLNPQEEFYVDLSSFSEDRPCQDNMSSFLGDCVGEEITDEGETFSVRTLEWERISLQKGNGWIYDLTGINEIERAAEILALFPPDKKGLYLHHHCDSGGNIDHFLKKIPDKSKEAVISALQKIAPTSLGDMKNSDFDTEAVLRSLEKIAFEYTPDEDTSISDNLFTVKGVRKFSWSNVQKYAVDHYFDSEAKGEFWLFGFLVGFLVGGVGALIYASSPSHDRVELHNVSSYTLPVTKPKINKDSKEETKNVDSDKWGESGSHE